MQTVGQSVSLQTEQSRRNENEEYECEKCKDRGYIYNPETGVGDICECVKKKALEKRLQFAKVPEQFTDMTVKGFDLNYYSKTEKDRDLNVPYYDLAERAKKIAINYVENFQEMQTDGKGLYIYYCKPGTGKTHLAVAVLNAVIKKYGVSGVYIVTGGLLEEIKRLMFEGNRKDNNEGDTLSKTLDSINRVDVLLLDDIGVEKSSEFVRNTLYNVLNGRYIHKKVTLFTSNCSIEELQHGERIQSRIQAMVYPVYLPGEDIRLKLAEKQEDDKYKRLLEGDGI
jgi:DNA replication protein DnaC